MADLSLHAVLETRRDARYLRQLAKRTEAREFARLAQARADEAQVRARNARNAADVDQAARQHAEQARNETRAVLDTREQASLRLANDNDRAAEARALDNRDTLHRLDVEQQLRNQQLEEDLRELEQERLDAMATAREEGEPVPRGHFLDLVA